MWIGARERFVSANDSNIGAIRQLFPRDRAHQDLHFDEISTSHAANNGGGGDTPTPPTPATDTTKVERGDGRTQEAFPAREGTGRVGRVVVDQLLAAGVPVRALTRRPTEAGLPPAVEVVSGDLTVPESLEVVLEGVGAVFLVWTAPTTTAEGWRSSRACRYGGKIPSR